MPGFSGPSEIEVDSTAFVVPSITVFGRNGQTVMVTDQSRRFRLGEIPEDWIIQSNAICGMQILLLLWKLG